MSSMCGRFALATPLEQALQPHRTVGLSTLEPISPSWNIAPTQRPAVVHLNPSDPRGPLDVQRMTWGLRPSWSRPSSRAPINARLETVRNKPMFRESFLERRGALPMDGWYEWKTTPIGQQPWYNTHTENEVLFAAVVHDEWRSAHEHHTSFAMLTTEANNDCSKIHHRMPVLLTTDELEPWIRTGDLPAPTPDGTVKSYAVSRDVNGVDHDHQDLIRPLPTLF